MPDLYTERTISVKAKCTPRDVYVDNHRVHDVYMAAKARKKPEKLAKATFEPSKLLAYRKRKGLSQHDLSAKMGDYLKAHGLDVGHSYSMIGRIERGLEPYNQIFMMAAAAVLGTDVKSLLFVDPDEADLAKMADDLVRLRRKA